MEGLCDLCRGSGAIWGIALSRICENVKVTASDCSEPALEIRETEREKRDRVAKLRFRQGDRTKAVGKRRYDLIASNPPLHTIPYDSDPCADEVKLYEPMIALDGGEDRPAFLSAHHQPGRRDHLEEEGRP